MDQNTSDTPDISAEPPFSLDPIAAFLKENCRKQEEAIQAIEDSAYMTRRGKRELRDPKRLALAVELRGKHMGNVYAFSVPIREGELVQAYVNEILEGLLVDTADSPEVRQRIGRRVAELTDKYGALKTKR